MADTVIRSKQEPITVPNPSPVQETTATGIEDKIEVPYLDSNNYLEDYFGLGTDWKDQDNIFFNDLEKIDNYIKLKIKNGEMENSQKAVKMMLKGMEKVNNLKNEGRNVVKLEVLSNYVDFLFKNEFLKSNLKRYGSN